MNDSESAFVHRFCEAFPVLKPQATEHVDKSGKLLPYGFMGAVARHAERLYASRGRSGGKEQEQLVQLFSWIEVQYAKADPALRELIEFGFLENLGGPPEKSWRIRQLLGPKLRQRIEELWPSEFGSVGEMP